MHAMSAADATPAPEELLTRVARGDEDAFRELYRDLAPATYGLALRVTRDAHMAQDVLQEAFADVWAQSGRFDRGMASARGWVTMLVHRRAVDRVRREQAERDRSQHWATENRERDHDTVAEVVDMRAEHRRVRQAVEELTDVKREALHLAYVDGLTHAEVADQLDIPLGTAKTRIRDALRALRTALEEDL